MSREALKQRFGEEIANKIALLLEQRESRPWSVKQVLTACDGYPMDDELEGFCEADELNSTGWEHHCVNRFQEALKCYRDALSVCERFPMVWNNKGLTHFRLGEFDEAKGAYERAIELNPIFIKPYSNLGILYYELKSDYAQARIWLLRALALDPNYQRAREYLANVDADDLAPDVLMIGADPDVAAGIIGELKKSGKRGRWIG